MSPHRVTLRVTLAAATLALAAAGCSGDDESTTPTSTERATTAPAAPTTTVPTAPTTTVPVSTTSTAAVVDASWCGPAADVRAASDGFAGVSTEPDELRDVVSDLVAALGDAADAAPDELVDEVSVVLEGADKLQLALEETDYDILTADLSEFSLLAADLEAANEAIREFNVEHCGFDEEPADDGDADGQSDDDGFDFGAGTFRDQFLGQLAAAGFTDAEADCIFAEIDFDDPESYSSDAAIVEIFVTCGIDLARIGELQVIGEG